MLRRSQLYVPGNNERMATKASMLEADSVILDLEDAVPEDQKGQARELVIRLSRELDWGRRELCVRTNPRGSRDFSKDIEAAARCGRVQTIVIPKADGDCSAIAARTRKALIPIVETASGLVNLGAVASSARAVAVTFGAADFAASVGGSVGSYQGSLVVKTLIAAAAAAFGLDAIDSVFFDLEDKRGFRREAAAARGLGFVGKQVVHPSQVGIANQVFSPTRAQLEWARKVVDELAKASSGARGAVRVDGKLVDAVHGRIARRILESSKDRGGL
ncbi:MAG: CoA ester lyase [Nitrososphaerota archaeon]|nr:CoA ester lyase [Nitrososphaerota archaeon]